MGRNRWWAGPALVVATMLVAGCAAPQGVAADPRAPEQDRAPVVGSAGSRPVEVTSLDELARDTSAIVVARATGGRHAVPLPVEHGGVAGSAPTDYVEMTVERVLGGAIEATTVQVVSPGDDPTSGASVLLAAGSVVLFLAPAMYAAGAPAGGYAVVGGPAGVFVGTGEGFARLDAESPGLPASVTVDRTAWPEVTASEAELLARGPG